jgi:hypothetical protein
LTIFLFAGNIHIVNDKIAMELKNYTDFHSKYTYEIAIENFNKLYYIKKDNIILLEAMGNKQ